MQRDGEVAREEVVRIVKKLEARRECSREQIMIEDVTRGSERGREKHWSSRELGSRDWTLNFGRGYSRKQVMIKVVAGRSC